MLTHLKVLFSGRSFKAWIAGLATVIGAYLIPLISDWLTALTPDVVMVWLSGYGVTLSYGLAAVVVGLLGVVGTYVTPNKRA